MSRILCFLHGFGPGGIGKTVLHLCAAWRDAGAEVRVMILGDGPDRAAIDRLVRRLGLGDRMRLQDRVGDVTP